MEKKSSKTLLMPFLGQTHAHTNNGFARFTQIPVVKSSVAFQLLYMTLVINSMDALDVALKSI